MKSHFFRTLLVFQRSWKHTSYPALRTLKAPSNMWKQGRIPWLDRKDDGYLDTVVVMPVLLDAQHLHGPSPRAVASLKRSPKLIHVNEPPSWHLKNAKGGGNSRIPTLETERPAVASGSLR